MAKDAFTAFEQQYISDMFGNLNVGMSELTDGQKVRNINKIVSAAQSGKLSEFADSNDASVIAAYQEALPSLSAYMSAAAILEGATGFDGKS